MSRQLEPNIHVYDWQTSSNCGCIQHGRRDSHLRGATKSWSMWYLLGAASQSQFDTSATLPANSHFKEKQWKCRIQFKLRILNTGKVSLFLFRRVWVIENGLVNSTIWLNYWVDWRKSWTLLRLTAETYIKAVSSQFQKYFGQVLNKIKFFDNHQFTVGTWSTFTEKFYQAIEHWNIDFLELGTFRGRFFFFLL